MFSDGIPQKGDMRLCARFFCVAEMNAVAPVNVMPSARGDSHPGGHLDEPTTGPRWERMIEHIHSLGPRAVAELFAEIAAVTGQHVRVVDRVEEYSRLDPEIIRFLGADRFPPMPLGVAR